MYCPNFSLLLCHEASPLQLFWKDCKQEGFTTQDSTGFFAADAVNQSHSTVCHRDTVSGSLSFQESPFHLVLLVATTTYYMLCQSWLHNSWLMRHSMLFKTFTQNSSQCNRKKERNPASDKDVKELNLVHTSIKFSIEQFSVQFMKWKNHFRHSKNCHLSACLMEIKCTIITLINIKISGLLTEVHDRGRLLWLNCSAYIHILKCPTFVPVKLLFFFPLVHFNTNATRLKYYRTFTKSRCIFHFPYRGISGHRWRQQQQQQLLLLSISSLYRALSCH